MITLKPDCKNCGGCCCRQLPIHEVTEDMRMDNGQCKHLNFWGLCNIYDARPNFCNVEWMYENVYSKQMTISEYKELQIKSCEDLRRRLNPMATDAPPDRNIVP